MNDILFIWCVKACIENVNRVILLLIEQTLLVFMFLHVHIALRIEQTTQIGWIINMNLHFLGTIPQYATEKNSCEINIETWL